MASKKELQASVVYYLILIDVQTCVVPQQVQGLHLLCSDGLLSGRKRKGENDEVHNLQFLHMHYSQLKRSNKRNSGKYRVFFLTGPTLNLLSVGR